MSFGNVEERIVEMVFDNKQFEQNAQQSMDTLNRFNTSLDNMSGASALSSIGDAVRRVDFGPLQNGVDVVGQKFSYLEVLAISTLQNIARDAYNYGKNIAKSLTIDPVMTGFSMYEKKVGAIQTILAATESKGETLQSVTKYIKELNEYSDKTIYSFSDMTQNIGKFTNAGVDLETAVSAIKGIANEAALSGANANEASRAMYNFSQALSAGYVKLIDWKSIENANMATADFKQQLIDTAVEMKTLKKNADGTYTVLTKGGGGKAFKETITNTKNFNDSLSSAWMTSEVLTKTLGKYADETTDVGKRAYAAAQDVKTYSQMMDTLKESASTGWSTTFEILFGNLEEAKKLWTSIANVVGGAISASAKQRNDLLQGWKDAGGRKKLIEALAKAFENFSTIVGKIHEEFVKLFPPMTSDTLVKFTDKFAELMNKLEPSSELLSTIGRVFSGVFSVFKIGASAISIVAGIISPFVRELIDFAKGLGGGVLERIATLGDKLNDLREKVEGFEPGIILLRDCKRVFDLFFYGLKIGLNVITSFGRAFKPVFEDIFGVLKQIGGVGFDFVKAIFHQIGVFGKDVRNVGRDLEKSDTIFEFFNKIATAIRSFGSGVSGFFKSFVGYLEEITGIDFHIPTFKDFVKVFEAIGAGLAPLKALFSGVVDGVKSFFGAFKSGDEKKPKLLPSILNLLGTALKFFGDIVKNVADTVGPGLKEVFSGLWDNLKNLNFNAVATAIKDIALAFAGFSIADFFKRKDKFSLGDLLEDIFGGDKFEAIKNLVDGLKGIFDTAKSAIETWQNSIKVDMLLKIAGAMAILTASLLILASIPEDSLSKALGAVTVGFAELVGTFAAFQKVSGSSDGKALKNIGVALLEMSGAVLILSFAIKALSSIDESTLLTSLLAVSILLAELVLVAQVLDGKNEGFKKSAAGLILMAVALRVLVSSVARIAKIDSDKFVQGLVGTIALLAGLAGFLKIVDGTKFGLSAGLGLIAMAGALLIISNAVEKLGGLDSAVFEQGLLGLGAALVGIAVSLKYMPKDVLKTALGLLVLSAALTVIAKVIETIGSLDIGTAMLGFGVLAGTIAILTAAMVALNDVKASSAVGILVMAVAVNALVPAIKALGKLSLEQIMLATIALAGAFIVLGGAAKFIGMAGVTVLLGLAGAIALIGGAVFLAGAGLLMFSTALAALAASGTVAVASIIAQLGLIFTAIIGAIPMLITTIVGAVAMGIVSIIKIIANSAMSIAESLNTVLRAIISVIGSAENLALFATTVLGFIVVVLNTLAQYTPIIIDAGLNLMISFMNGMADGIRNHSEEILGAVGNLLSSIIEMILSTLAAIAGAIPGIGGQVSKWLDGAKQKVNETLVPGDIKEKGVETGQAYAEGVKEGTGEASEAGSEVGKSVVEGFNMGGTGGTLDIGGQLLNGLTGKEGEAQQAGNTLGAQVKEGLFSGLTTEGTSAKLVSLKDMGINPETLLSDANGLGTDIGSGLANGINADTSAESASSTLGTDIISAARTALDSHSPSLEFEAIGKDAAQGLANGLNSGSDVATTAAAKAASEGLKQLQDKLKLYDALGKATMAQYALGIRVKQSLAVNAMKTVGTQSFKAINSYQNQFYNAGQYAIAGFVRGLYSKSGSASSAARAIANASYEAAKHALDEHSPSKAFEQLGVWADEGLIIGFESLSKKVSKAGAAVAVSATDSVTRELARLPELAEMDYMPTITPVIDLTSIEAGGRDIRRILSNQTIGLNGLTAQIDVNNSKLLSDISAAIGGMEYDNSDVVAAINSMKADIAMLGASISNMKVMLNRRIVGQIDTGLGQEQLLASRGV